MKSFMYIQGNRRMSCDEKLSPFSSSSPFFLASSLSSFYFQLLTFGVLGIYRNLIISQRCNTGIVYSGNKNFSFIIGSTLFASTILKSHLTSGFW